MFGFLDLLSPSPAIIIDSVECHCGTDHMVRGGVNIWSLRSNTSTHIIPFLLFHPLAISIITHSQQECSPVY